MPLRGERKPQRRLHMAGILRNPFKKRGLARIVTDLPTARFTAIERGNGLGATYYSARNVHAAKARRMFLLILTKRIISGNP